MIFIKKGKEAAFEELYQRYSKKLLYFFYQRLDRDAERAQDFLQELFMKIVEKPELFDGDKNFSTWLYSIAANLCKNEYRRNSIKRIKNDDFRHMAFHRLSDNSDCENVQDYIFFGSSLNKALKTMGEKHSLTFILRHQEGFSVKEVSEIMGCTEGTVKSRLFYAIRKLSQKLSVFSTLNHE